MKKDSNVVWSTMAELSGKSKPELSRPQSAKSDLEAATQQNDFFVDKINKLKKRFEDNPIPADKQCPENFNKFSFHCIGAHELKKALKSLSNTPAQGSDGIPLSVWKAGMPALCLPLLTIINQIITLQYWPTAWKNPGKPADEWSSFRPVAILSRQSCTNNLWSSSRRSQYSPRSSTASGEPGARTQLSQN